MPSCKNAWFGAGFRDAITFRLVKYQCSQRIPWPSESLPSCYLKSSFALLQFSGFCAALMTQHRTEPEKCPCFCCEVNRQWPQLPVKPAATCAGLASSLKALTSRSQFALWGQYPGTDGSGIQPSREAAPVSSLA